MPVIPRCQCKHLETEPAQHDRMNRAGECTAWVPDELSPSGDYCPCLEFRERRPEGAG